MTDIIINENGEALFPEGLTEISNSVFSDCKDCKSLKKITIPSTVTKIREFAFDSCERLENVILPEGLTEIGCRTFSDCKSLKKIIIPNTVTKIGGYAFYACTNLEEVILPEGLTEIGDDAFSCCFSLKKINIPNTVTKIGKNTFQFCKHLEEVIFPEGLTEIGDYAFSYCYSLKKITIPNTVIRIGERVFSEASGIIINFKTSLFQIDYLNGLSTPVHVKKDMELIIYNCKITSSLLYDAKWNAIRKTELLDIINNKLIENGIYQKNNYKEHKKIIDEILFYFDNEVKHYDYRNTLEPYLEKYIEEHKPANMLVQLNNFVNKSISEVTEELTKLELEEITSDSTYIEIFGLGKKMNEYPLYISSIILNTISKYSKDTKIKQLKQTFDKLSSSDKKRNIFQKIFFKSDDNGLVLNEELWNHLNNTINNEIILSNEEIEVLNNIKELISIYVSKLQEYINYLENYSININPSLNEFDKSNEMLKVTVKDSKKEDFKNLILSISEKYGQVNLVISNNLIYMSKLNEIKTNLLPSLIDKTITNAAIGKDISIVKDTIEISRILEELINNEECMNNTFENNQIEEKEKQLIK